MKINYNAEPRLSALIFALAISLSSLSLFGQADLTEPWEKSINERQPPEIVFKEIGVKPGMIIGEIGAGRGRYTVLLATKTGPSGKVFANDIDEASLAYLRGRCKRLNIKNVETIVGETNDPLFPDRSLDMAIMVLVYHMIDKPDNLLLNLKKSMKPGAKLVIVDPRDEEIDSEFGIDRSQPGMTIPTIQERVRKSAFNAGYNLVKLDTILPHDYIFVLEPTGKKPAAELIQNTIVHDGITASSNLFNKIKTDTLQYDLSEKGFALTGYEFIGEKAYPEAIAILGMGIELYPKSSRLYGELGEIYLFTGDKEKARKNYRLHLQNGTDSLNAETIMQNFDVMYEQMRPK